MVGGMFTFVGESRITERDVLGVGISGDRGAGFSCWISEACVDEKETLWRHFDASARYAAVVAALCAGDGDVAGTETSQCCKSF
jgi:hypothetical protein